MVNSQKQVKRKREQYVRRQEAMKERRRLAAIVESSEDAIIGKDQDGIIMDWNEGAERLYGYRADEVIGKPISLLMPPDRADDFAEIMGKIKHGEHVNHFETERQRKDGTRVAVSLTVSPIFNSNGRIVGASAIARDISKRKRAEEAARESEELLRMAAPAGKVLAYEWDATTDEIARSEGVKQILGEDEGRHTTGQQILTMILPEDRERLLAAVAELSPEKPFLRIRYRMVRSDGRVVWVDRNSHAYFDERGKMLRLVGTIVDITDRVRADEDLRQKGRELSEAQRLAGVGSWHWDIQNDIAIWSEELYRIAGRDPMLPAPNYKECPGLLSAESWERLQRAAEVTVRDGRSFELNLEMIRPDRTTRWVTARGEAVRDTTGRILRLRGTAQDITERKLSEEALARMSRKLLEAQEQERARIARELHDDISQQLALLSADIQQMKEVLPVSAGKLRSRMNELETRTLEISTSIQLLSHELHSSRLEYLGVVLTIRSFCKEFGDKHKVNVEFVSEGIPHAVSQDISLCLFRVVQEGLHNALKHSGVRFFEVKLQGSPNEIFLTIRDSGVGFDPQFARETQGLGLITMQERVRMVNGTISITSRPQSGTEISVRVPLSAGEQTEQAKLAGA
jgi:PAS domain S-box-containing protein